MSWFAILLLVIGLLIGYSVGWKNAHKTVATECQRLGSFYVGNKVFKCVEIEEKQK